MNELICAAIPHEKLPANTVAEKRRVLAAFLPENGECGNTGPKAKCAQDHLGSQEGWFHGRDQARRERLMKLR